MKVKVDAFLNGETPVLKGTTSDTPKEGIIKSTELINAADLGFDSEDDRYQIEIDVDGEDYKWLPNKTSLKAIIAAFGDESDAWNGKIIKLFAVEQNVSGKIKKVAYAKV